MYDRCISQGEHGKDLIDVEVHSQFIIVFWTAVFYSNLFCGVYRWLYTISAIRARCSAAKRRFSVRLSTGLSSHINYFTKQRVKNTVLNHYQNRLWLVDNRTCSWFALDRESNHSTSKERRLLARAQSGNNSMIPVVLRCRCYGNVLVFEWTLPDGLLATSKEWADRMCGPKFRCPSPAATVAFHVRTSIAFIALVQCHRMSSALARIVFNQFRFIKTILLFKQIITQRGCWQIFVRSSLTCLHVTHESVHMTGFPMTGNLTRFLCFLLFFQYKRISFTECPRILTERC